MTRQAYGIANAIGVDQISFEVDYPHQDTTWPDSDKAIEKMAAVMSPIELEKILRGNALEMLGLDPEAGEGAHVHLISRCVCRQGRSGDCGSCPACPGARAAEEVRCG